MGFTAAVHYACSSILSGESDTAIAAGVNIITNPSSYQHIDLLRILSPTYHSPILTPHVTGYTRGEAAIALVLKRLSKAQEDGDRIVGLLRGTAACHNGRTGRHMATPSLEGQSRVIMEAMDRAGLESNEINYVELHATGTQAGDKRELQTVMNVYGSVPRKEPVLISGIKSLYGHSEAASGITSLLKALLALRHRAVPPIVHFTTPRTEYVCKKRVRSFAAVSCLTLDLLLFKRTASTSPPPKSKSSPATASPRSHPQAPYEPASTRSAQAVPTPTPSLNPPKMTKGNWGTRNTSTI